MFVAQLVSHPNRLRSISSGLIHRAVPQCVCEPEDSWFEGSWVWSVKMLALIRKMNRTTVTTVVKERTPLMSPWTIGSISTPERRPPATWAIRSLVSIQRRESDLRRERTGSNQSASGSAFKNSFRFPFTIHSDAIAK